MDKISMLGSDYTVLSLSFEDNHFYVSYYDAEYHIEVFKEKCDAFIKGDIILHLKKAINKYKQNRRKVLLSRWYPFRHKIFAINMVQYPYISISIENRNGVDMVVFKVYLSENTYNTYSKELSEVHNFIVKNKG